MATSGFTSRVIDGLAGVQIFVFDAQATDEDVQFTVDGQSDGVRLRAPEFTQDSCYVRVRRRSWCGVFW